MSNDVECEKVSSMATTILPHSPSLSHIIARNVSTKARRCQFARMSNFRIEGWWWNRWCWGISQRAEATRCVEVLGRMGWVTQRIWSMDCRKWCWWLNLLAGNKSGGGSKAQQTVTCRRSSTANWVAVRRKVVAGWSGNRKLIIFWRFFLQIAVRDFRFLLEHYQNYRVLNDYFALVDQSTSLQACAAEFLPQFLVDVPSGIVRFNPQKGGDKWHLI